MTILLNNRCHFPAEYTGLPFWTEWPLPVVPGVSPPLPATLPTTGTTYTRTQVYARCYRYLFLEGAVHNGSTYTSLGTITSYGYKIEDSPATPEPEERPLWWRNGVDMRRFTFPQLIYPNGFDEYDKTAGFNAVVLRTRDRVLRPASYSFTVSPDKLFESVVAGTWPFNCGTTVTGEVNPPRTSVDYRLTFALTSPSPSRNNYNANGVLDGWLSSTMHTVYARIAGDDTIYRLGVYDAVDHYRATITPPLQKDASAGSAVTPLRHIPMPPGIPHDLMLYCTTFKYRQKTGTVEYIEFATDWQGGSAPDIPEGATLIRTESYFDEIDSTMYYRNIYHTDEDKKIVWGEWGAFSNGSTRIVPYLYYSPCEPRSYYAT